MNPMIPGQRGGPTFLEHGAYASPIGGRARRLGHHDRDSRSDRAVHNDRGIDDRSPFGDRADGGDELADVGHAFLQ